MAQTDRSSSDLSGFEPGFDIPALPGWAEAEIHTPALLLDLDALERNLRKMGSYVATRGLKLRVHGKMHKSVDVFRLQQQIGGATGICCQKVSEAEVFARAGVADILISNELRDLRKIDRLARLPLTGAKISVCLDDVAAVSDLSQAAERHGTKLHCLVEVDCGAGRCGVQSVSAAVSLARAISDAAGLIFAGVQGYQGALQHVEHYEAREAQAAAAILRVSGVVDALTANGLPCETVTGGGTGSYMFEAESGVYTELQCGSYAFMDADYGRILDQENRRFDEAVWENALFVLTEVMSTARPGQAVVDAGLKSLSLESGLPVIAAAAPGLRYAAASDEHGEIADPDGRLKVGDRLRLIPGHCDPTCNLHDWYVGVRNGVAECLWPVSARGKSF